MYRDFSGDSDSPAQQGGASGISESGVASMAGTDAAIGVVQRVQGAARILRGEAGSARGSAADLFGVQPVVGTPLFEGDVIETGADGLLVMVLVDGTTFQIYAHSHFALDRYTFGADKASHAARLRADKGKFGVMAGQIAAAGRLVIETPLGKIQNVAPLAGVASLGFMFLLCLIDDVQAGSESQTLWLIDDTTISYKDFEHGVFELVTRDGVHIIVDDPAQTIVLHPNGSNVGVERVTIDRAQIVALQEVYQRAYATFVQGLQDPFLQRLIKTSSEAGSSTLFQNGFNPFTGKQASLYGDGYVPPANLTPPAYNASLPAVVVGGVTIGATFTLRLPVSNAQTAPVYLGPSITGHADDIFLNLTVQPNEKLTTVVIDGLPAGEVITSGSGKTYQGGQSITILAADFYSGLTLSHFTNSPETLTITATVFGAGGPRLTVTTLALTVDAPVVAQPDAVHWVGPDGGDWNTAANWSTGAVPIPHQDVFIDTAGTVISSGAVDIASLAISAGAILDITGGTFTIETSAVGQPLANDGTIVVSGGGALSVGDAANAGVVVNSNLIQIDAGTLTFTNLSVTNSGATIEVDAGSTMNLADASIVSGTLTNAGSVVSTGTGLLNGVTVTTGGTLEVASGTLTIENGSVDNGGGSIKIDAGATLALDGTTITGGAVHDNGTLHVVADSTLNGGVGLDGGAVSVDAGITVTLDNVTVTGSVITNADSTSTVKIDSGKTLTLSGATIHNGAIANGGTVHVVADSTLDSGAKLNNGAVSVDGGATLTLDGATVTGSTVTMADATAILNVDAGKTLTLSGVTIHDGTFNIGGTIHVTADSTIDSAASLNNGEIDVDAGVTLTLDHVTIAGTVIVPGASTIVADGSFTVDVSGSALADNAQLTLSGSAAFVVTALVGNLDASAVTGGLTVTTGDAADNAISIAVGSGNATINGSTAGDVVTVDASGLADSGQLTLTDAAAFSVTGLTGSIDASGLTGALTVTAGDATDNAIAVTAGTGATTVTANGSGDIVTVDASALPDNTLLTLSGSASFIVTGLAGNLDASAVTGGLTVTTGDAADNAISIAVGSGNATVNGSTAGDVVTVDASALADNGQLTLTDSATFHVTGLTGSIDASALTGALTVTAGDATDNAIAVTAGTGATTVTANGAGDTVTVDAAALPDNTLLTLSGSAAFVVTGLVGDLDASAVTGGLTVTTGDAADNSIAVTLGSGAATITGSTAGDTVTVNAAALADGVLLTLLGLAEFTVSGLKGNLKATALSGALHVTTADVSGLSIATGNSVNTIDATALAAGHVLNLTGDHAVTVSLAAGNLDAGAFTGDITLTGLSGANTVTTGSGADTVTLSGVETAGLFDLGGGNDKLTLANGDNTLTVHNIETLDATALTAGQVLTLSGSGATAIQLNAGNLDASAFTGDITLTGLSGANTVTTGSGADTVTLSGAETAGVFDLGGGNDTLTLADGDNTLTIHNI
ncbi:MAG: hypothetical protein GC182_16585, partial [Rhodopseudomonas sp.]|nr:hypothetical protein [Rhodopseudomonas sp.]